MSIAELIEFCEQIGRTPEVYSTKREADTFSCDVDPSNLLENWSELVEVLRNNGRGMTGIVFGKPNKLLMYFPENNQVTFNVYKDVPAGEAEEAENEISRLLRDFIAGKYSGADIKFDVSNVTKPIIGAGIPLEKESIQVVAAIPLDKLEECFSSFTLLKQTNISPKPNPDI